jgi:hypothetical protein
LLDGEPWKSFSLSTLASHTAIYPDHPEITPGAEKRILIDLPAGVHRITITLDGTAATSAALRIQVNDKELIKKPRARSSATTGG